MNEEQRRQWLLKIQELTNEDCPAPACREEGGPEEHRRGQETGKGPDVDSEWEKFAVTYAKELEALGGRGAKHPAWTATYKVAASVAGVLLMSGMAFAAIGLVRSGRLPQLPTIRTEQLTSGGPLSAMPADTLATDSAATGPYVFRNVTLDSLLTTIAAAHGVEVAFASDEARQLRFYFVWKRDESLARVVEKLNTFEAVAIGMEEGKLVVR